VLVLAQASISGGDLCECMEYYCQLMLVIVHIFADILYLVRGNSHEASGLGGVVEGLLWVSNKALIANP
jgi:hypothetical protein